MKKLDDQIITEKLKDIGLEVKSIRFLDAGKGGDKYIVETHTEVKYILKIPFNFVRMKRSRGVATYERKVGSLQEQMDTMRKINEKETICIEPVHDKPLNFGSNNIGYVYKFIDGVTLADILHSKSHKITSYEVGKFIGKFHKLTKDIIIHKSARMLVWRRLLKKLRKQVELIKISESEKKIYPELKQDAAKLIESMSDVLFNNESYEKGRTQLIHGDLHPWNIIVSDQNKWIIIDTDNIHEGNISHDISWYMTPLLLVWETLSIGENPKDHFKKFLSGYNSEYKLTKNEIKNLPLVLVTRLMNTLKRSDPSRWPLWKLCKEIPKYKSALKSIILIME